MRPAAKDALFSAFCWLCGLVFFGNVGVILGYLLYKGMDAVNLRLLFGDIAPLDAILLRRQVYAGIWPAVIGTVCLVFLALLFALPVGLAAGIYMAQYGRGRVKYFFSVFFDILASVPSIVVGLFGFSVAVFLHHHLSDRIYPCLLISALSLAFLVLPYIIRTTQMALEAAPAAVRQCAPALGATKLQNIFYVLLPHTFSSLFSGVILAIGRCAEDTAVIMLTGVVASAGIPRSLFSHFEALPFYVYYISAQYNDPQELATGYGAAIILLLICLFLFSMASVLKSGFTLLVR